MLWLTYVLRKLKLSSFRFAIQPLHVIGVNCNFCCDYKVKGTISRFYLEKSGHVVWRFAQDHSCLMSFVALRQIKRHDLRAFNSPGSLDLGSITWFNPIQARKTSYCNDTYCLYYILTLVFVCRFGFFSYPPKLLLSVRSFMCSGEEIQINAHTSNDTVYR